MLLRLSIEFKIACKCICLLIYSRHVVYAPSSRDAYSASAFPGLTDLLFQIEGAADATDRWEKFRKHLAVLQFIIDSAASTLKPVTEFN